MARRGSTSPLDFSFFQRMQHSSGFATDDIDSPEPMPPPCSLDPTTACDDTAAADTSQQSTETLVEVTDLSTTSTASSMSPPKPRKKIPFEKGYSQMDWLKLTNTHSDLAGLSGRSSKRLIGIEEVKQHKREDDAWTVLRGKVYNITPYFKFHPGGLDMLIKAAGKDCTSLFNKYHAWVNAEYLLEKCLVGILDSAAFSLD